jgi:hemerythrin-like domain-containing protein
MTTITSFMTDDHRDCDDAFVDFENMIAEQNWAELKNSWDIFSKKLNHHFEMEETVLFPAFESATGMTNGPTAVMRSEHQQMRNLCLEIEQAVTSQNEDQCQGIADTLMIMIQQHNMKEEQMLYPMTDQHTHAADVITAMQSVET